MLCNVPCITPLAFWQYQILYNEHLDYFSKFWQSCQWAMFKDHSIPVVETTAGCIFRQAGALQLWKSLLNGKCNVLTSPGRVETFAASRGDFTKLHMESRCAMNKKDGTTFLKRAVCRTELKKLCFIFKSVDHNNLVHEDLKCRVKWQNLLQRIHPVCSCDLAKKLIKVCWVIGAETIRIKYCSSFTDTLGTRKVFSNLGKTQATLSSVTFVKSVDSSSRSSSKFKPSSVSDSVGHSSSVSWTARLSIINPLIIPGFKY